MNSVKAQYIVNEKIKNYDFSFPSEWSELSKKQLLDIAPYLQVWKSIRIDKENIEGSQQQHQLILELKIHIFRKLANISEKEWNPRNKCFKDFSVDDISEVIKNLDWLMSPGLTSDLLPKIRIGSTAFYSSGEYMNVITGAEFFYTEAHYESFFKEQNDEALNKLIAVLYRPAGEGNKHNKNHSEFCGDIRESFNDNIIQMRSEKIARLPHKYKCAILNYYEGCRASLVASHPEVFEKGSSDGKKGSWLNVFDALSSSFTDLKEVSKEPLAMILFKVTAIKEHSNSKK